jgi:hypothetical protein
VHVLGLFHTYDERSVGEDACSCDNMRGAGMLWEQRYHDQSGVGWLLLTCTLKPGGKRSRVNECRSWHSERIETGNRNLLYRRFHSDPLSENHERHHVGLDAAPIPAIGG